MPVSVLASHVSGAAAAVTERVRKWIVRFQVHQVPRDLPVLLYAVKEGKQRDCALAVDHATICCTTMLLCCSLLSPRHNIMALEH
jgi:hypothetical protein